MSSLSEVLTLTTSSEPALDSMTFSNSAVSWGHRRPQSVLKGRLTRPRHWNAGSWVLLPIRPSRKLRRSSERLLSLLTASSRFRLSASTDCNSPRSRS